MNPPLTQMVNGVTRGDCLDVMKDMPSQCIDFILTDPPYFVRYKDRSGRTIRNDRYPGPVLDAFRDVYRVMKPDRLCVSFFGAPPPELDDVSSEPDRPGHPSDEDEP